jgi:pimeloyl-ACP methyl ester carboxylesterase
MEQWKRDGKLSIFNYAKGANADLGYQLIEDSLQYEDFPAFQQPALIFHGVHDASVPSSYSERFAAQHPNATLRLMDSDHELISVLPQLREEALAFLQL